MRTLIREPLVRFLLLGAAIFAVYGLYSSNNGRGAEEIVVTAGHIDHLATTFARMWQRPPTQAELKGLIDEYIREEVYAREAAAIGLDRDDTIIRRRLRQKLEFVTEDLAAMAEPTERELQGFLDAHPDLFRVDQHFTFKHVFLNADQRGDSVLANAEALLADLNRYGSNADPASWGDATLLERKFEGIAAGEVAGLFGTTFAEGLAELSIGRWQGPVESGYGLHLVLVSAKSDPYLPALDEVRDHVRREWTSARRTEANERFYQSLLARYTVVIEPVAESATNWQTASAR